MNNRKIHTILLIILAAGFLLRLFPVRGGYHYWDETVYLQHAEIIAGESPDNYDEFEFRPPLFPILLTPIVFLTESVMSTHIVVSLLSTLGIFVTYWLAEDLFGTEAAIASSVIYALSPLAIRLSHEILVDSVLPLLWVATAASLYRGLNEDSYIGYIAAGVFLGLSVLMKFTSLVLIPAVILAVLVYRRDEIRRLYRERDIGGFSEFNYLVPITFVLTLLPYLLWSYFTFDSPFHVFVEAMSLSGATDPFMTYIEGLTSYILLPFYIGVAVYFRFFKRNFEHLYLIIFILALVLPAQFWLGNKELRFLLPIVPFLAIIAGRGFSLLNEKFDLSTYWIIALLSFLILISSPLLVSELDNRNPLQRGLVMDSWHPPVEDASLWLENKSDQDAVVYTNYRYPPIGYYSKRTVKLISNSEPLNKSELEPGYVYYSDSSPFRYPEKQRLVSDEDFVLNKTFDKTVSLFYFTGEKG